MDFNLWAVPNSDSDHPQGEYGVSAELADLAIFDIAGHGIFAAVRIAELFGFTPVEGRKVVACFDVGVPTGRAEGWLPHPSRLSADDWNAAARRARTPNQAVMRGLPVRSTASACVSLQH